jgi:predicted component of viral defense system (DUF524 family)
MLTPKDIQDISCRLDTEIKKIDDELNNRPLIDQAVTRDLELLLGTYKNEIIKSGIDVADIQERYRHTLKSKKIEALLQARRKLEALRTELTSVLSDTMVHC